LDHARANFDDSDRVRALTELERDVVKNKELFFACVGSQEMQVGVLTLSLLQHVFHSAVASSHK